MNKERKCCGINKDGAFGRDTLLESICGVNLSKSKVTVTELKLPIGAATYAPAEKDVGAKAILEDVAAR